MESYGIFNFLIILIVGYGWLSLQIRPAVCALPADIRLVEGSSPFDGIVEVQIGSSWERVCQMGWSYEMADHVCQYLGFTEGAMLHRSEASMSPTTLVIPKVSCARSLEGAVDCKRVEVSCSLTAGVTCNFPGYLGCFTHSRQRPIRADLKFSNESMTIETCLEFCRMGRFQYAGLAFGQQCLCNNRDPDFLVHRKTANSNCMLPCKGDRWEACGGVKQARFYETRVGVCGGKQHPNDRYIASPMFPGNYGRGSICTWKVSRVLPNTESFTIKFVMMRLLPGDTVRVTDMDHANWAIPRRTVVLVNSKMLNVQGSSVKVIGNGFYVEFQSALVTTGYGDSGFMLTYHANQAPTTPPVLATNVPSITNNPLNPLNPLNPNNPHNPHNPHNPLNPLNPNNPHNPHNPLNPNNPHNPLNPNNPHNPHNPLNPNNPLNPLNPNNPTNPHNPLNPNNPHNPLNPLNPFNPNRTDTTHTNYNPTTNPTLMFSFGGGDSVESTTYSPTFPSTTDIPDYRANKLVAAVATVGIGGGLISFWGLTFLVMFLRKRMPLSMLKFAKGNQASWDAASYRRSSVYSDDTDISGESQDYDYFPDIPGTPGTLGTLGTPGTPGTPDTPDTPDTPITGVNLIYTTNNSINSDATSYISVPSRTPLNRASRAFSRLVDNIYSSVYTSGRTVKARQAQNRGLRSKAKLMKKPTIAPKPDIIPMVERKGLKDNGDEPSKDTGVSKSKVSQPMYQNLYKYQKKMAYKAQNQNGGYLVPDGSL